MTPAASRKADTEPAQTPPPERSHWLWVPSLYFAQGIPYVIVMTMSVIMYKRLGVSNTDIALYTSWLYLPWVIKPLWSPIVDITRTKRLWVVAMQFFVSIGLALVAISVQAGAFFTWSLILFGIMAFASATHDIAADGFYMLSLSKHDQAWWVGLRSTFYRAATIVGSGLLVVLAGVLESKNGLAPVQIQVHASVAGAPSSGAGTSRPRSSRDVSSVSPNQSAPFHLVVQPESLDIPTTDLGAQQARKAIDEAKKWNLNHGFIQEEQPAPLQTNQSGFSRWWAQRVSKPLSDRLKKWFPKQTGTRQPTDGNVATLSLSLSAPPPPGRTVIVTLDRQKGGIEYLGLAKGDKGFRLKEGERLGFTSANWDQPARAVIQLDPKLKTDSAVTFIASSGNIPLAWTITLFIVGALFLGFSCWHSLVLPRPANDRPVISRKSLIGDFFNTLGSFFQKPGVLMTVAFILFYRFDEAQLVKVISPFLLDSREAGGLGLATSQVGLAYGTFGIAALTCGGLLGGFLAAKQGLKRMLPIMVCSMYLPKLAFIFLSFTQPENFLVVCGAIAVEQFGYGFGFTAFMLVMLYFADGPHKTAHYAICTGFMALGMMLPGMWSGWLADLIGYKHFFVWVIFCTLPGFTLAMLLKVEQPAR